MEILIAGGLLAPGGSIQQDGEKGPVSTSACIFQVGLNVLDGKSLVHPVNQDANDLARIKQWDNVIIKLMRRYKYLEKMLSEEMKKILVYLRGFTEQHRTRLAQITAIWCCSGLILPNTIVVVINEHQVGASNTFMSRFFYNSQVKDSIALNFMIEVLNVVKTEKGSASVLNLLKKSGMDTMLTELFPTNKRSSDNMKNHFVTAGLPEIVTYLSSIENAGAKKVSQI